MPKGPAKLLFFDWRHICCGHLSWRTAAGEAYGVAHPPEPPVPLHAVPVRVPHGVRLQAQPASKTGPVDDWKGWGRIIYHDGAYRTWYLKINGVSKLGSGSVADLDRPDTVVICAAQSPDGFTWTERELHALDLPGLHHFDGLTFLVDPVAPEAERYKFIYCAQPSAEAAEPLLAEYAQRHPRWRDGRIGPGRAWCLWALTSPDGERWTPHPQPLMMHPSDTDTTVTYDADLGRYVVYTRLFRQDRRWVGRAESEDFWHWGPLEPVIWPRLDDPPDHDVYLNGYSAYPGQPDCHLMFPMFYHRFTERSDIRLYSSPDNVAWTQVPGGPVIECGAPDAWDSEFIGCGKDLVPFGPGRMAIPYSGTAYPHKYPRWPHVFDAWQQGWAVWGSDRLCALVADRVGEFWTMPQAPAGHRLRLNARVPRGGLVQVGVGGLAGHSADDCDPITGDRPDHVVSWHGEDALDLPEGQPVMLHVRLRAAELFAIEWVSGA